MKLSTRLHVAAAVLFAMLAAAPATLAAEGERTPLKLDDAEAARAASEGGGSLARTFIGLAIVVAVIYGVYWILKQVKASREERVSGSGLTSLATLPLGPGRTLHMVRAGNEVVLVGSAEHGITPIRTYAEPEARAAGMLDTIADDELAVLHELAHAEWPEADGLDPDAPGQRSASTSTSVNGARPGLLTRTGTAGGHATAAQGVRQVVDLLRQRTVRR